MFRYYRALFFRVPRLLLDGYDKLFKVATLVIALIAALNQSWANRVSGWSGFSPAWTLFPLGALLVYGLMRANYASFLEERSRADGSEEKLSLFQDTQPELGFTRIESERVGVEAYTKTPQGRQLVQRVGTADFVRVNVANDPKEGRQGSLATDVIAHVDFFSEDGKNLLSIAGRWAETDQPPEVQKLGLSLAEREISLSPNGLDHPLDIAMKYPDDEACYAFNDLNGARAAPDMRYPPHELSPWTYQVVARVRGHRVPELEMAYKLVNPGKGQTLSLSEWAAE
ncbi:MAG: hypothetical protein ABI649_09115 [Gaiellaceae bacterium]